jgi:hypothetical protein
VRRRPALEPLEGRDLPSGLSIQFQIDDPGREFNPYPLLRKDLDAVGQILSGVLNGQGTVQVIVRADDTIPRSEGSTVGITTVGSSGEMTVTGSAALAAAQTGVNPNGGTPEIELDFNARDYLPHVWFDPSGAARTGRVPAGRADFISVALHEMLHGLGFQGYRAITGPDYGAVPGTTESTFDDLSNFSNGTMYFRGPLAAAVYGGPVPLTTVGPSDPLTSQNFYHVGNPSGRPGAGLSGDLMNGMQFQYGTRYSLSKVDLAMLADLGWNVAGFPAPGPFAPAPQAAQPAAAPPPANLPSPRQHPPRHGRHARHARLAVQPIPQPQHAARRASVNPLAAFLALFI